MSTAMKALVTRQRRDLLNVRRRNLLDAIRAEGGMWRTGDVVRLYRANGWGCCRSTARGDLQYLTRRGLLAEHGPEDARWYTAVTQ
ncbi:MAG TPA: hypothetical protein VI172_04570 [Candidatus Dormibacteraeota bacterium]